MYEEIVRTMSMQYFLQDHHTPSKSTEQKEYQYTVEKKRKKKERKKITRQVRKIDIFSLLINFSIVNLLNTVLETNRAYDEVAEVVVVHV